MNRSAISGRFVSKLWARWMRWFVIREERKWDDFKIGGSE
jgi:hypothetical protein